MHYFYLLLQKLLEIIQKDFDFYNQHKFRDYFNKKMTDRFLYFLPKQWATLCWDWASAIVLGGLENTNSTGRAYCYLEICFVQLNRRVVVCGEETWVAYDTWVLYFLGSSTGKFKYNDVTSHEIHEFVMNNVIEEAGINNEIPIISHLNQRSDNSSQYACKQHATNIAQSLEKYGIFVQHGFCEVSFFQLMSHACLTNTNSHEALLREGPV